MNKPNFRLCEKLATQLLACQNITSTRINVQHLEYDKTIIFDSIQNYANLTNTPIEIFINTETQLLSEGCCIPIPADNLYIILYNDKIQSEEHLNWTLAHEVGHIYLGHKYDSGVQEIEAHFFAAQLLMPEYVIYKMDQRWGLTIDDIYMLFNVSMPAAKKRLLTYSRKPFINKSTFDEHIWKMMQAYIQNYYIRNNASEGFKRFLSIPMIDV